MKAVNYLLSLIFPRRCAVCSEVLPYNKKICDKCFGKLKRTEKICEKCGNDKKSCRCKRYVYRFEACVGPFFNDDVSMSIIANLKFKNDLSVADFLCDEMAECFSQYYSDTDFDVVCCVPSSFKKRFNKGYNQSEVLARGISERIGVPYRSILAKKNTAKTQHSLKASERFENVKNAFFSKVDLDGETVLLIDDIKTTGATLNDCARALSRAGANRVFCLCGLLSSEKH